MTLSYAEIKQLHVCAAAVSLALFVYIALGTFTLRCGRKRGVRIAALTAALATFGYIVSVAVTKSSRGFITWF